MSTIDISVERPLLFLILIPALILGIIPFLRLNKKRRTSTKHLIPFIIHLTLIFVLSALLGGVVVTEETHEKLETKVIFVADMSDSNMKMKDEMNSFIKSVIEGSDVQKTKFAVVMFAGNKLKTVDESKFDINAKDFLDIDTNGIKTDQTNIEQAITIASELFTQEKQNKKMILLTDGLETVGDGIRAASQLDKHIQLNGAYFNMVEGGANREVQLISVNTTGKVAEGEELTVELVIQANKSVTGAEIKVEDGDTTKTIKEDLKVGTNVFKVTYKPEVSGVNTIRASVKVGSMNDTLEGNNSLFAWYSLDAQRSILIVDGDYGSSEKQFAQIQKSSVMQNLSDYKIVGPISPRSFPSTLEAMLEYDQVIMMDVNFADLPSGADVNIRRYVEEVGRGLFVSFGDSFYEMGQDGFEYKDSPIAEILPVELTLKEERETVAMVLVVDLSSSMRDLISDRSRFDVVLESVKKVLMLGATEEEKENGEGFGDSDYIGVVCFDQDCHVALEMQQLGDITNREQICEKVDFELRHYFYSYYIDADGVETEIPVHPEDGTKYTSQGYTRPAGYDRTTDRITGQYIKAYGTSYKWAVQAASDMLSRKNNETPLHIKQVLFMSDGAPNDKDSGYEGIIERMAKAGTVTSTIAIGSDGGEAELSKIAEAGKGKMVKAVTADDLTSTIVEKAEEVTPELINEQIVQPYQLSLNSTVIQGVRDYKEIGGYYSSSIKQEANLVLYVTDYLKPLYAEWNYGLGKVSVYMSDLGKESWTGNLFKDVHGITLVTNMLDATMNRQVDSTGIEYSATRNETVTNVTVNVPRDIRSGEHLIAQVFDNSGSEPQTVTFGKLANKKYRANLPTTKTDETYTIKLMIVDDKTNTINDTTTFAVTGYYNSEYDVFNTEGRENLVGMVNNADGEILEGVGGLFDDIDGKERIFEYDINTPLVITALVLFVLDILFRSIVIRRKKKEEVMTDEQQIESMRGR